MMRYIVFATKYKQRRLPPVELNDEPTIQWSISFVPIGVAEASSYEAAFAQARALGSVPPVIAPAYQQSGPAPQEETLQ